LVTVKITTRTRLGAKGWIGAVLLAGGPMLAAIGYLILRNGDPAGAAWTFILIGFGVIGLGLVLLLVGREYHHDVVSPPAD